MRKSVLQFAKQLYFERETLSNGACHAAISPAPDDVIELIINDLKSETSNELKIICDCGCGDGRWLTALTSSMHHGKCLVYGLELDGERIEKTLRNCKEKCYQRDYEIIRCDFLNQCYLSIMNVIILYLSIKGNELIKDKIKSECSPGTVIFAVGFSIKDWSHVTVFKSNRSMISCYKYILE